MFFDFIESVWNQIIGVFSQFTIINLLDILIVTYLIYKGIQIIGETRAGQLVKGILILLAILVVSGWMNMTMLNWLLTNLVNVGLIAVVVVFQPELRRILERAGRSKLSGIGLGKDQAEKVQQDAIDAICKSCANLSKSKTGALIILEGKTMLSDIADTGTIIDADVTSDLIENIFFPNSPLHDGAVLIRFSRIYAAGCILPLTENSEINKELGTRHRAAIGISEVSDCVAVIVSEETGIISVAKDGVIKRGYNHVSLNNELTNQVFGDKKAQESSLSKRILKKFGFGGVKKNRE